MKLSGLSFACYVYAGMSDYDSSYRRLRNETLPQVDLLLQSHQLSLLRWLNDWGCRQFAKEHHGLAANEIGDWYRGISSSLFPSDRTLPSLSDEDLNLVQDVFDNLAQRTASRRKTKGGSLSRIEIGPTGAAKILFAIRPHALVPWDIPIRGEFGLDGSARSYRSFLLILKDHLTELNNECEKDGLNIADLPVVLRRQESTPAKMVDEFFWVTITRKCRSPNIGELRRWADWF